METKKKVDDITKIIKRNGWHAIAIHGDKSQPERDFVLAEFRNCKNGILVATDVAARGLDVEDVKYVVNYDYPNTSEDYIHRIGRTGRCQNAGTAFAYFTSNNARQAKELVEVLQESNQYINPQLAAMANAQRNQYKAKPRWNPGQKNGGQGLKDKPFGTSQLGWQGPNNQYGNYQQNVKTGQNNQNGLPMRQQYQNGPRPNYQKNYPNNGYQNNYHYNNYHSQNSPNGLSPQQMQHQSQTSPTLQRHQGGYQGNYQSNGNSVPNTTNPRYQSYSPNGQGGGYQGNRYNRQNNYSGGVQNRQQQQQQQQGVYSVPPGYMVQSTSPADRGIQSLVNNKFFQPNRPSPTTANPCAYQSMSYGQFQALPYAYSYPPTPVQQ